MYDESRSQMLCRTSAAEQWAWLPRPMRGLTRPPFRLCAGPASRCRAAGSAHALSMRYRNRHSPRSSGSIGSAPGPIEPNHSAGNPMKTRRYGRSLSSGSNVSISIPVNSIAKSFSTKRASSLRIRFVVLCCCSTPVTYSPFRSSRNTTAPYRALMPRTGGSWWIYVERQRLVTVCPRHCSTRLHGSRPPRNPPDRARCVGFRPST